MEAEPKLILGYLILISDTKSNQFLLLDQLISIFFNPNFTKLSIFSKNVEIIQINRVKGSYEIDVIKEILD